MAQFVANPRTTFSIVASENRVGPDDQRALIVGQMTTGQATAGGLTVDVPRTDAEINSLFGADSHLAMVCRAYREVNPVTNVDCLPLADNGSGTAATGVIAFSGTATADGTLYVTAVSEEYHAYQLDVLTGDTAAGVATKLMALIAADRYVPFTSARSTGTVTLTAANKGTHANDWLIRCTGYVAGITTTLTGWTGGATNPSLTTLFDPIQTIRYQTIIYPAKYDLTVLKTLLNARKNVDNNIMDGMGFIYQNTSFGTVKSQAATLNSSEIVLITNEPTSDDSWKGPHVPEATDCIAAKIAAALDLRLEPDVGISSVVVTNAPLDQFGGVHTNSLPAFNTPLIGVGMPKKGTGYTLPEQLELETAGVSVIGANRAWNAVITGGMVTTWLNDAAGNPDNTWHFLEWRRTHGAIREYFQRNCQKEYRQTRLTTGAEVVGYDMVNESAVRSFCKLLYIELSQVALTVAGLDARTFFEKNLQVTLIPASRQVKIAALVPMVSQLGVITGTIEYSFQTA